MDKSLTDLSITAKWKFRTLLNSSLSTGLKKWRSKNKRKSRMGENAESEKQSYKKKQNYLTPTKNILQVLWSFLQNILLMYKIKTLK